MRWVIQCAAAVAVFMAGHVSAEARAQYVSPRFSSFPSEQTPYANGTASKFPVLRKPTMAKTVSYGVLAHSPEPRTSVDAYSTSQPQAAYVSTPGEAQASTQATSSTLPKASAANHNTGESASGRAATPPAPAAVAGASAPATEKPIPVSDLGAALGLKRDRTPAPTAYGTRDSVVLTAAQEPLPPPAPTAAGAALEPLPTQVAPAAAAGAACADGNCLWNDVWSCCETCCEGGLILGVEGTFLAPFGEPDQSVCLTNLKDGSSFSGSANPGFGSGVRTWLGMHRCGWGWRFQYWHFGDRVYDPRPVVPSDGGKVFDEVFALNADVIDIELTQGGFCCCGWEMDASFGGRYARLERKATAIGYGTLGGVDLFALAMGANELEGAGFTFSIGGRRQLGCSNWHFFWGYRGSLLWADTSVYAMTEVNAVSYDPAGSAHSRDSAFACQDKSELYISELRLGLEYQHCLQCLPATAFFRVGMEYQHWNTGDLVAGSSSYAYLQGGPPEIGGRADARANAHDGDLDLIGFVIGVGLTY